MAEEQSFAKQPELPKHVEEAIEGITGQLSEVIIAGLAGYMNLLERAYEEVRQEQPHLFIEYRQPRNAREKIKQRRRAAKIASRAKKRHNAIQSKLKGLGADDPREIALDAITEVQIRQGFATPESEVVFLERIYERE